MHVLIPNLKQFFEDFLRFVQASNIGLNKECDPDRADNLLCLLRQFERTLGVTLSRLGQRGAPEELLSDLNS